MVCGETDVCWTYQSVGVRWTYRNVLQSLSSVACGAYRDHRDVVCAPPSGVLRCVYNLLHGCDENLNQQDWKLDFMNNLIVYKNDIRLKDRDYFSILHD